MSTINSYKELEIYNIAFDLSIKIYLKTIPLPVLDKFETGRQIRRSSQSIKDTIVEGYGRRKYKADFIKFLIYSHASLLEATSQAEFLEKIFPNDNWSDIVAELNQLGIKIHNFIIYVEKYWRTKNSL